MVCKFLMIAKLRLALEERYLENNSFEKNQLGAAPTELLFYSYWQFYKDVVPLGH